jgi:PKD repeat protein
VRIISVLSRYPNRSGLNSEFKLLVLVGLVFSLMICCIPFVSAEENLTESTDAISSDTENNSVIYQTLAMKLLTLENRSVISSDTPDEKTSDVQLVHSLIRTSVSALDSTDTESYSYLRQWGGFDHPEGIAVDSSGNVYVANYMYSQIRKFDSQGTLITSWGTYGTGNGQFNGVYGVAVDTGGYVFVTDMWNHRIQKFSSAGTFITQWGTAGTGDGQFNTPTGVAVDNLGYVYVVDANNERVQKFSSIGTYITQWGARSGATWIAADASGHVYVSDSNNLVSKYDSTNGDLLTTLSDFNWPNGVAVDSSENLYVADGFNYRIQKYDSDGVLIAQYVGVKGTGDGQFNYPKGIAVDVKENIYVTDYLNNRVQVFKREGKRTNFGAIPVSGTSPLTVQFKDTSLSDTSKVNGWCWKFGTGGSGCDSSEKNPKFTYTPQGSYSVSLTALWADGSSTTKTKMDYITVEPFTFSITCIENYDNIDDVGGSIQECDNFANNLSKAGYNQNFYNKDGDVIAENFGTDPSFTGHKLTDSAFHYHSGHATNALNLDMYTYLNLKNYDLQWTIPPTRTGYVDEPMVDGKWGGNSKWVMLDSCNVLQDPSWGQALTTSHGILGFKATSYVSLNFPKTFTDNAINQKMTMVEAYKQASQKSFTNTHAAVVVKSKDILNKDQFPGVGYMSPDPDPNDKSYFTVEWPCNIKLYNPW